MAFRSFFCAVSGALLAGLCSAQPLSQDEQDLLHLVADGFQSNVESIVTWQGRAQIKDTGLNRLYDERNVVLEADFAHDSHRDATRWRLDLLEGVARDGEDRITEHPYFVAGMHKGDRNFRFGPYVPATMSRPYTLLIKPTDRRRAEGLAEEFDPMFFFESTDSNLPKRLRWLADLPYRDDAKYRTTVHRDENTVIVETANTEATVIERYTFDLALNGAMVSYLGQDSSVSEKWEIDYEETDDHVFMPVRAVYERGSAGERAPQFRREVMFVDQSINQDIPESAFEFESMGVLPGDTVHDTIVGVEYTFKPESTDLNNDEVVAGVTHVEELDPLGKIPEQSNADIGVKPAITSTPDDEDIDDASTDSDAFKRDWYLPAAVACVAVVGILALLLVARKHRQRTPTIGGGG